MPPAERVTLKALAEQAGVHPSTVSRVLNDRDGTRVADETAARIRRLADELGYEPDRLARSLRLRRTMAIGVVVPRLTDVVLATMVEAASERANVDGYQTVTVSTRDEDGREEAVVDVLLSRQVDGLILGTASTHDDLPRQLADRGLPFVLLNRRNRDFPVIAGDDREGGRVATAHLLERGHERVAIVAGPPNVSTAALRLEGYRQAHRDAGLVVDESLVVPSDFSMSAGEAGARHLLDLPSAPTAIFAVNDFAAIGCMASLRAKGLTAPEDVAIVGYNDIPIAAKLPVPLSSVALPLRDMGRAAVEALLGQLMRGEGPSSATFSPELRVRKSSDANR